MYGMFTCIYPQNYQHVDKYMSYIPYGIVKILATKAPAGHLEMVGLVREPRPKMPDGL